MKVSVDRRTVSVDRTFLWIQIPAQLQSTSIDPFSLNTSPFLTNHIPLESSSSLLSYATSFTSFGASYRKLWWRHSSAIKLPNWFLFSNLKNCSGINFPSKIMQIIYFWKGLWVNFHMQLMVLNSDAVWRRYSRFSE